jgi:hypothetical protein
LHTILRHLGRTPDFTSRGTSAATYRGPNAVAAT